MNLLYQGDKAHEVYKWCLPHQVHEVDAKEIKQK